MSSLKGHKVLIHQAAFKDAQVFSFRLKQEGMETHYCRDLNEFEEAFKKQAFLFCVLELDRKNEQSEALINLIHQRNEDCKIIVTPPSKKFDESIDLFALGISDCLFKPIVADELVFTLKKNLLKKSNLISNQSKSRTQSKKIISSSPLMDTVMQTVEKIGPYKTTCLILGESGTGKELLASAIHEQSIRSKGPFITVNCGAIPENLLESELFGHKKGAFTGAVADKKGLFEEANKGTLFLDEIGELPLLLQVKLLRVLQEEEIRKVGDIQSKKIDVRIVAATLKSLEDEVRKGNFREDLYYRLNVLPIQLPALRERKEDIPILVEHFIAKKNKKFSSEVKKMDEKALAVLIDYDWPGNIRELENTIERSMILVRTESIEEQNLPAQIKSTVANPNKTAQIFSAEDNGNLSIKEATKKIEYALIVKALKETNGNKTKASKLLEISHRALLYKIKEFEIKFEK